MIETKDVSVLDILPYIFKTSENKALSEAIKTMTGRLYKAFENTAYRSDIQNADAFVLDVLAAELDCPFYSESMNEVQKKSVISAAGIYNSRIGTVGAVKQLIGSAFGEGELSEWFEYSGKPYHFKIRIKSKPPLFVDESGLELFFKNIDKIKPVRTKMEDVKFTRSTALNVYAGGAAVKRYKKIVIRSGEVK